MRFGYAEAAVIVLGSNLEFSASVTVAEGVMSYRTPEQPDVVVEWRVEHAWTEGKTHHLVTSEVGEVTVQRKGGCGCH